MFTRGTRHGCQVCTFSWLTLGMIIKIISAESVWPNGPYALPVPKFGCPESSARGWRRGYINITFTLSRARYAHCQKDSAVDESVNTSISSIVPSDNTGASSKDMDVSSDNTDVSYNGTDISFNDTDVSYNDTDVSYNDTDVSYNGTDISFNYTDVSYNDTDISYNYTDLSYNYTDISYNYTDLSYNYTDVSYNDTDISYNDTDVSSYDTDVSSYDTINQYGNYSHILGPFDDLNFQINFCFKLDLPSDEESMEGDGATANWPAGHYSIYGAESGCPQGFTESLTTLCLPPILRWSLDGYVPYFDLQPGIGLQETLLTLRYCTRDDGPDKPTRQEYSDDALLLIKDNAENCPLYTRDVVYPYPVYNSDGDEVTFCLQPPNPQLYLKWGTLSDCSIIDASIVAVKPSDCHLTEEPQCSSDHWITYDFTETVTILDVQILLSQKSSQLVDRITVGNEQWSFFNNGGTECVILAGGFQHYPLNLAYTCVRPVRGRYITIQHYSWAKWSYNEQFTVVDFTASMLGKCLKPNIEDFDLLSDIAELGMRNNYIEDYQIWASSSLPGITPNMARPHLSGWCAADDDVNPYIQIDVLAETNIGGFIIYNNVDSYSEITLNTYSQCSKPLNTGRFKIMYGSDKWNMRLYANKTFQMDLSKPYDEPQTFTLLYPFSARHVRIYPQKDKPLQRICLRLELLGLRKCCLHSTDCELSTTKEIFNATTALISDAHELRNNYTLDMCKAVCLTNASVCLAVEHSSHHQSCKLYKKDVPQRRLYKYTIDRSGIFDYLGAMNCRDLKNRAAFVALSNDTLLLTMSDVHRPDAGSYYSVQFDVTALYGRYGRLILTDIAMQHHTLIDGDGPACGKDQLSVFGESHDIIDITKNGMQFVFAKTYDHQSYTTSFNGSCIFNRNRQTNSVVRSYFRREGVPSARFIADSTQRYMFNAMNVYSKEFMASKVSDYDASITILPNHMHVAIIFTFDEFYTSCAGDGYIMLNDLLYCNANRPFGRLYISDGMLEVHIRTRQLGQYAFGAGFRAHYSVLVPGNVPIIPAVFQCSKSLRKCYQRLKLKTTGYTWQDAHQECITRESTLLTIRSRTEFDFFKNVVLRFLLREWRYERRDTAVLYLGMRRNKDHITGQWQERWIDGIPLTFTAWENNEPRNVGYTACAQMRFPTDYNQTLWASVSCKEAMDSLPKIAMCERPYLMDTNETARTLPDERLYTYSSNMSGVANESAVAVETSTLFRCGTGEYVLLLAVCNGLPECADSSDESKCLNDPDSCRDNEFECDNGECVHISVVCDFTTDCQDGSDEYCDTMCNETSEFACTNGQCINADKQCDANRDCLDGSDEISCESCNPSTAHRCGDATCIPARLLCDHVHDCNDNSDEASCDHLKYRTCDDIINLALMGSGIYETVDGHSMECDFKNVSDGVVTMKYLNSDWTMQAPDKIYLIDSANVFQYAIQEGYDCTQDFTPVMRALPAEIAELDLVETYKYDTAVISYTPADGFLGVSDHTNLEISMLENGKIRLLIHTAIDTDNYRIPLSPIICNKTYISDIFSDDAGLFPCGQNLAPVPTNNVCRFQLDPAGRMIGCRNLVHLQNCENVACEEDYVKCADSYCIPASYVCNGRMDCPRGDDEQNCFCGNAPGTVVLVAYSEDDKYLQHTKQLATSFLSRDRQVYIMHVDIEGLPQVLYEIIQPGSIVVSKVSNNWLFSTMRKDVQFSLVSMVTEKQFGYLEEAVLAAFPAILEHERVNLYRLHTNSYTSMNNPWETRSTNIGGFNNKFLLPVLEVSVQNIELVSTILPALFPDICTSTGDYCDGGYVCSHSRICIPIHKVCDASTDCPLGDDERLCGFQCPENCTCDGLAVSCINTDFSWDDLTSFPDNIKSLTVGNNTNNAGRGLKIDKMFVFLSTLNVSRSGITDLMPSDMAQIPNLRIFDLRHNMITELRSSTFVNLKKLQVLLLEGNTQLTTIQRGAFTQVSIKQLSLRHCGLKTITAQSFTALSVDVLDLSSNKISSIEDSSFAGLTTKALHMTDNDVKSYSRNVFIDVDSSISQLKTDSYKFCCFRPTSVDEKNCLPHADEFSSCDDLMRNSGLQALLWIIGIFAVVGNISSILFRVMYDRARLKIGYGIFVTNLALSDLLMGVYLLVIAVADVVFRKRYIEMDDYWRSSVWCNVCGLISTISSEASVLFMCLITLDRILVIKYPFGQIRFSTKSATYAASACWFLVVVISAYPLLHESYFGGRFYTSRAVCVALPLTRDQPPGWLYSVVIFIGFNLMAFMLIAFGQYQIYDAIKESARNTKKLNVSRSRDLKVARNLLLIVTTDFICWFPIGVMGIMAMGGYPIPGEVYSWTVVLILPINSALNPVMYTFSVLVGNKSLNPDVDEQKRSELSIEQTLKTMQGMFKRVLSKTIKMPKMSTLDIALKSGGALTTMEALYVVLHLTRQLTELHSCSMTVEKLLSSNVMAEVNGTGHLKQGGVVLLNAVPKEDARTKDKASNVYQLGMLLGHLITTTVNKR